MLYTYIDMLLSLSLKIHPSLGKDNQSGGMLFSLLLFLILKNPPGVGNHKRIQAVPLRFIPGGMVRVELG